MKKKIYSKDSKKIYPARSGGRSCRVYQLYLSLLKNYKKPREFWQKWCKRRKTIQDKEEIALGAILTQRTNWKNVEQVLKNLKKAKALSIEKVYRVGNKDISSLENLIRPSGFYKQKAKRLFQLCQFIVRNYGNLDKFFEKDLETCQKQLLEIYGIGFETADSILLYAGQKPVFVIDEYTRRFVKKHHLSKKISYEHLQNLFEKNLPNDIKVYQDFHALIVLEGKNAK